MSGKGRQQEGTMDALMLGGGRSIPQVAPAIYLFVLGGRSCWFGNAY